LGLTLWSGEFEGQFYDQWLRWCDQSGNVLLTGDEKFELEKQRAEAEGQRADRLAQLLREQGIDPILI
jgi:phage/plasmid-associated DNA primase